MITESFARQSRGYVEDRGSDEVPFPSPHFSHCDSSVSTVPCHPSDSLLMMKAASVSYTLLQNPKAKRRSGRGSWEPNILQGSVERTKPFGS